MRAISLRPRRIAVTAAAVALGGVVAACGNSGVSPSPPQPAEAAGAQPVAALTDLRGQSTTIALDEGFTDALAAADADLEPVGDARLAKGKLKFPITAGEVQYFDPAGSVMPFVQGRIAHAGSGLRLSAAGKDVELTDLSIDPGAGVATATASVGGDVIAEQAPLFALDGRTLQPLRTKPDGRVVLEGATVRLTPEAAKLVSDALGGQAPTADVVGRAKLTLAGKPAADG